MIVNFDEWGGFFEHVPPPRVIAPNNVDPDLQNGQALLGFRVPTVIASPFTFGMGVDGTLYDHTSALKLIEWRWGLNPLTARDASGDIGNPANNFNFAAPNAAVPQLPQPSPVFALPCFEGGIFSSSVTTSGVDPHANSIALGAKTATRISGLSQNPVVRDWLNDPRFKLAQQK